MTREIKFRAWSKRFEQMFQNELLVEAGRQLVIFVKNARPNLPDHENAKGGLLLPTDDEDLVFMQYTGLKDRNGVEIYEKDLLEKDGELFVVEWGYQGWHANGKTNKWTHWAAEYFEVNGNIYSTPHLLEQ